MIYKDLEVWKLSMNLVVEVYQATGNFPKEELFGLVSQIRRTAVSIPSNIAEGCGRKSSKEYIQFLYISKGSLLELETQFEIAFSLKYLSDIDGSMETVKRLRNMLIKLIASLENR